MDSLYILYQDTLNLYRRFWDGQMPTSEQIATKLREECEELITALDDPHYSNGIPDEAIDVIRVATGACLANGYSIDEIYLAVLRSVTKNSLKQSSTHERVGETIVRKDRNEKSSD